MPKINFNNFLTFHHLLKTLNHFNKINFFVQVGAHDGMMHDPLCSFLSKNEWSGILIEPQEEILKIFKNRYKNRSNLLYYTLAVHPNQPRVKLYTIKNPINYSQTGWATILSDRLSNGRSKKELVIKDVKAMPLMDIVKKSKFKMIGLLQVDTEGFDYEVLKMFNFKVFKPILVQFEYIHLSKNDYKNSVNLLSNNGYKTIKKKNDIIAIKKNKINIILILYYLFFRLKDSINSRFGFNQTTKNDLL